MYKNHSLYGTFRYNTKRNDVFKPIFAVQIKNMERLQIGIIADGGRTGQTDFTDQQLRNNIYNLFMAMDGEMTQNGMGSNKAISRSRTLIIRFLKLVAQHFRTTREVSFYAQQLLTFSQIFVIINLS